MIEYALIASLIALAILAGVGGLGKEVGAGWNDVSIAVEASDGVKGKKGKGQGKGKGNGKN